MNTSHTPAPWNTGSSGFLTNDGGKPIMGPKDQDGEQAHIAFITCQTKFKRGDGWQANCVIRDANAAHIVKCVNSHDELVAALKATMRALLDANESITPEALEQQCFKALSKVTSC